MAILTLTLRGPAGPLPLGAPADVEVEVRNESERGAWVVGVVDGSEEGVRFPKYAPSVVCDGLVAAAPPPPEDPLVGPLRLADFVFLSPGQSFDPTVSPPGAAYHPLATFATFRPRAPGRYVFSLTLTTESASPDQWLGRFNQDEERDAVLDRVTRVPRLTVRSNDLVLEYR